MIDIIIYMKMNTVYYLLLGGEKMILFDERINEIVINGTIDEIKNYLGSDFNDCIDSYDVNEKLKEENAGMVGYIVIE